jgi:predicted DNA-binding WGR domain protein
MSEHVFEFVEGTSSKFWAVTVSGTTHTVRYGKIGTAGQSKAKTFADAAAAAHDAGKLVAEKAGKGYVETTAGAPSPTPAVAKVAEPEPANAPPGAIERRVDLDYSDWLFATWRPRDTLPPLPPQPPIKLRESYAVKVQAETLALFRPERFVELLATAEYLMVFKTVHDRDDLLPLAQRAVIPYMTDAQKEECRAVLRPLLTLSVPSDYYEEAVTAFRFHVAALLGMPHEMRAACTTLAALSSGGVHSLNRWLSVTRVGFGLGSAADVSAVFRQMSLHLRGDGGIAGWLAHTLWHELDYATDAILAASTKPECEGLMGQLARVHAPETAPEMVRLMVESKTPGVAKDWLFDHPALTVAGLVPVAQSQSKIAKVAGDVLRELKRKGHGAAIEQEIDRLGGTAAASVRSLVFSNDAEKFAESPASALPEDLRDALSTPDKPLGWVDVAGLPPIVVGGGRLGEKHVTALLNAIKSLKEASLPAAVVAVRRHAEPRSLDAFAWALFEAWQREGMPSKEKWAFAAMGHLGGDASALKLTPLIREWPGEGKHQTAVMGVKVLCGIGSDTALMSLNGVAQKVKFNGVKKAAQETMEQIASARGMSRAELEDRIVPDLGLDARGGRDLDFGPRQFRVLLDGQLNPVVREADGKPRGELPKPNAKDDAAKADAAVAEWKLLKKQLKEVVKLQSPRLELAMVTMRRWPVADFESLIVKHPLMANFARRLVWGGFDQAGKYLRSFRVTEELDYTRADDKPADLGGLARVGIVHPMQLDAAERGAWGQLFADYELVPPFTQLGRPVFELTKAEATFKEVTRFAKAQVAPEVAWYGLQKMGWVHGIPADGGHVDSLSKSFPGAGFTAQVHLDPGLSVGWMEGAERQAIAAVRFVVGEPARGYYYADKSDAVPLGQVDPIVVSEVLSELSRIAAKAE